MRGRTVLAVLVAVSLSGCASSGKVYESAFKGAEPATGVAAINYESRFEMVVDGHEKWKGTCGGLRCAYPGEPGELVTSGRGGMEASELAERVDDAFDATAYVPDTENYGQTDLWVMPATFLEKGGDCEDYAMAKLLALRDMGVPENRLRLAVVDSGLAGSSLHTVVLFQGRDGATYVLDNRVDATLRAPNAPSYDVKAFVGFDGVTKPDGETGGDLPARRTGFGES